MMKYHFLGKDCIVDRSLNDQKNFHKKIKELGFNYQYKPLFVNQIHDNKVVVIDDMSKIYQSPLPKADALVTNIKHLPIAVITADCVPIIFCDKDKEIAAIAHAGWKGAKGGIIENTIKEMINIGAQIQNINVKIGPSIRQKSYEVSKGFFDDFLKEDSDNKRFFILSKKENHFMFDLPKYCIFRLENLGIKKIEDKKIDTYENEKTLFSYRRSTHKKEVDCGRNISVIMLA